jgi:predicted GNAT family acetyltransferase
MNEKIEIEHNEKKGRVYITVDEKQAGEMTFVFAGPKLIIIDHTKVEQEFNGKGYGKLLVARAVEFAREKGLKIKPLCPYAKSVFDKTTEYKDVLV